jgi:hypothetical protein
MEDHTRRPHMNLLGFGIDEYLSLGQHHRPIDPLQEIWPNRDLVPLERLAVCNSHPGSISGHA